MATAKKSLATGSGAANNSLNGNGTRNAKQNTRPGDDGESILETWEEISRIKQNNQTLKEELDTEVRLNSISQPQLETRLEQLQEQTSQYARLVEVESKKHKNLLSLITLAEESINKNKERLSQSDGMALPQLQSKEKQLEHNLEKIRGRHNEQMATIQMMKEHLNIARRERVIFSNVFKKLEQDIKSRDEEYKKEILRRLQFEQIKKNEETELKRIKKRAKREIQNFKREYEQTLREAEEEVENQKKDGKNNTNILQTDANTLKLEDSLIAQRENQLYNANSNYSLNNNSKILLQKPSTISEMESNQDELAHYQFVFKKLEHETGISDMNELVELFQGISKINENLYKEANAKSDKIVEVQKQIVLLDKKIAQKSQQGAANNKAEKQLEAADIAKNRVKARLQKITEKVEQDTNELLQFNEKLKKVGTFVHESEPETGLDAMSSDAYLRSIEQKIDDILAMVDFCDDKVYSIDKKVKQQVIDDVSQITQSVDSKKERDEREIGELIDNMRRVKESEKIFSRNDFADECQEELNALKQKSYVNQVKKKQQSRMQ